MEQYLIGIDAGTSMIKSVLFDRNGNELYVAGEKVSLLYPAPGLVEQDMNAVWRSVRSTVRELVKNAPVPVSAIAAIAITGQADGVWLVGEDGEPVCNSYNWTDGRAMEKCIQWMTDGTDRKIFDVTGSTFYPGSNHVLTSWMLEHEPEKLRAARWNCICMHWIKFKFTGEMTGDDSYNILGNTKERRNEDALLDVYGFRDIREKIPPVRIAAENHAPLLPEIAGELGLPAGIPVFGGPFDFVACAIGSGTLNEGDACAIIGTTTNVSFAQNQCDYDPDNVGYTLCSAGADKWIRAFGVMAGTPNLEWTIGNMGLKYIAAAQQNGTDVYEEIEKCVREIPLGSGGIVYHPYMLPGGERSPFVKPTARAQFFGIGVEHTTDHLMRAVYEGVGYSILDCIRRVKTAPRAITVTGGGAKSAFWCQLIADITGIDVVIAEGSEFGARGAAMAAGAAIGMYQSIEEAAALCVREKKRYTADPAKTAKYAQYFELYRKIYEQMWDLWDLRAGIMQG